ncbi:MULTISPECIES: mechanosensitive ion channel family protein [unclassified Variovorax]|uniref:mechanosensitive ion channel family protein n=1 Tax=unclassified Variovorax TaxID=663243 RepID=UPI002B230320|nr:MULTISPECIES: mechanosensitive ion channel family protein [unclassified Variovorax]MEB0057593.1 mechanosensitive ion channel family protein [Variovorax sp. LG9.2]MEB0114149.1 mechanosensitive ion channel family protein [Variovorax sp. RTB1]
MNDLIETIRAINWERWSAPALSGLRIVLIVVVAWIAISVLQRAVRVIRLRVEGRLDGTDSARRAETLGRVVRYLIAMVISAVAVMLVLAEVGVSLAPILGAAGVVGLAIGFGAQSLVKDYFTGFFILFEDQIRTGDVVSIAGIGGSVEDITLRHVRLRDYDGNVHFVPNGLITSVTNMSRSFAQAVMDVGVSYREDVDQVMALMAEVGRQLRADPDHAVKILGDLEIAGVERLDDSAVVLRCRFKVAPLQQWTVRREYLRRMKAAFDAQGIEIPFPHVTVYAGVGKDGSAPALPVRLPAGALEAQAVLDHVLP